MVERPRLAEKLARAIERPLTVIAAPAGSGKTALLSSWAEAREPGHRLAWLGLGPEANSRRRFWTEVVAALQRADATISANAAPRRGSADAFLPALVAELESLQQPIVLVLDDFHEVTEAAVLRDLDRLLDHPPDRLRLVLATRCRPVAPAPATPHRRPPRRDQER